MNVDVDLLKAKLRFYRVTQKHAGEIVGLSRDSFIRRLREKDFHISEIHRLMESVPLTMKEVEKILLCLTIVLV